MTKAAAVSFLFLSNGSQANKVVCRDTVYDFKLTLVTLAAAAAVEAARSEHTVGLIRAHLTPTADKFSSKCPFHAIFLT